MREIILLLIKEKPKHYGAIIKRNKEMLDWIKLHSKTKNDTFAEDVYQALYGDNVICKYGSRRKFKSVIDGYVNCGRARSCQCTREAVSKKVSISKKSYSDEKKANITSKRVKTSLAKYGVTNNGQSELAKTNHSAFYNNPINAINAVQKNKASKLKNHGNENYNNSAKIARTWKEKTFNGYFEDKFPNIRYDILNDKEKLLELVQTKSFYDIASICKIHIQTVYKYTLLHGLRRKFRSKEEIEIVNYLHGLGVNNIISNTRKILNGKELDIYLPDHHLAIEFNGVFWHTDSRDHITRTSHQWKFLKCEEQGIQLLTIFSNYWDTNKDIVKKMIKNKLGLADVSIYARKCIIRTVDTSEARVFLNTYHIQGYTSSSWQYGLMYCNELVAIMTFSKKRVCLGKNAEGYELVRFASAERVVGGASKLLKHFITANKLSNTEIYSYSDNEWSNGKVYSAIGFNLESEIPVSYKYLSPKDRGAKLYHRYTFAKHKLVAMGYDRNKTGREITDEMGLLRVWDCGKRKWVFKIK